MTPRKHKLFYGSSYDRGLDILLYIWSNIREEFPDAELHVCYGWDLFDVAAANNPERQKWKEMMLPLMDQEGIVHHGRVGKEELSRIRRSCGIWAYPTYFTEINCITALEAQNDGLVPVVIDLAALKETVKSGVKVKGNIRDPKVMKKYKDALIKTMKDGKEWKKQSSKAEKVGDDHSWQNIAMRWSREFEHKIKLPKVSIITPTIRSGFFPSMYQNICDQTYKGDIEWIIVDDKKDRDMNEFKHDDTLKVKYLRGGKSNKFRFNLSTSNNVGIENADGELLIWLQDFVYMPEDAVERLVDTYLKNPNYLIAPVDEQYESAVKVDTDKYDWFGGKNWKDIFGKKLKDNVRQEHKGLRKSEVEYDFEMNFGAIPMHILKKLNGFWEFFNDGLGYDNAEICWRAMQLGYGLFIDDSIVAKCIDHWEPLKYRQKELGEGRTHSLNDPRYVFYTELVDQGHMPIIRSKKMDKGLDYLKYEIPAELDQEGAVDWMRSNTVPIVNKWIHKFMGA